ncbi:MAG: DnaA/Hda family protein [Candidatus Shapirobacteria bacterium]|nr:DnaA/Hda family protein [Candidatus Shapirobacteria bacterium]
MELTKTIEKLLTEMGMDLYPWEIGDKDPPSCYIQKDQIVPESKKCLFCGEDVLVWKIDGEHMVPYRGCIPEYINKDTPTFYRVTDNYHPKCKKLMNKLNDWGISKKRAFESDNFIVDDSNKNAFLMVQKWIETPASEGLYLYGAPGVGKTLLATKIILESKENDKLIVSESDIYESLTPDMNNKNSSKEKSDYLYFLRRKKLLIIDDIGTAKSTPWKMETLFSVISKRIDYGLPTFFTSNYSPSELSGRVDSKIASRVFELSNPCMVGGVDHRLMRG